jgi:flagella basal body P-ring formation protein FlgA
MTRWTLIAALLAAPAAAQSVAPAQTVRAGEPLRPAEMVVLDRSVPGAFARPSDLAGLEARRTLHPGRPILHADVGLPTVVRRNTLVEIVFARGALEMRTGGRALDAAAEGEPVRVLNLISRSTVTGVATASGDVRVD